MLRRLTLCPTLSARVTAAGGSDSYTWLRGGKLPRRIKSRPTKTGVFSFTLTAIDPLGARFVKRYTIRGR